MSTFRPASDSTSADKGKGRVFTLPALKDHKPASVKLDNIESLTGKENYEDWADTIRMVMRGMGCLELVVVRLEPSTDVTSEERQSLRSYAELSYPNANSGYQQTDRVVAKFDSPHKIWSHL